MAGKKESLRLLMLSLATINVLIVAATNCDQDNTAESGDGLETCYHNVTYTVCQDVDNIEECLTLEETAILVTQGENSIHTSFHIDIISDLTIDGIVAFRDLDLINITGHKANQTITCISGNSGFIFENISSVALQNIRLQGCGAIHTHLSPEDNNYSIKFSAALNIVWCRDVFVNDVLIINSRGAGLLVLHIHEGVVNVSNSQFKENSISESDPVYEGVLGGGGMLLATYSTNETAYFYITNCTFEHNTARNTRLYKFIFTDQFGRPISGSGRGGGLFLTVGRDSRNKHIHITQCTIANNKGYLGAGLLAEIKERGQYNSIIVEDSMFEENGCGEEHQTNAGGGALLTFDSQRMHMATDNIIKLKNVTFLKNCAILGGGTYFFTGRSESDDFNNTIFFKNSTWVENFAHAGSAVDFTPHIFDRLSNGYLPIPTFEGCKFFNNTVQLESHETHQSYGEGTMYLSLFSVKFLSSVHFQNNSGSAIVIVNGVANFSDASATFIGNRAVQGGAIALVGLSSMVFGPYHSYLFENNSATDHGGAIYSQLYDEHDLIVSRSCFIQHFNGRDEPLKWSSKGNTSIIFRGNRATGNRLGHAIFATSLIPCQVVHTAGDYTILNASEIFDWFGITFDEKVPLENLISTNGARFVHGRLPFRIIPGEEYQMDVAVVDDLNQMVNSTLRASMSSKESNIRLDTAFSCIYNTIRVKGKPGQKGKLMLQTVSARKTSLVLDVVLAPCPPGFTLSENECVCDAFNYPGMLKCNETHMYGILQQGFWAGLITVDNMTVLATSICPLGFCEYNMKTTSTLLSGVQLPRDPSQLNAAICGPRRTGILCSTCNSNYTVHFHSPYFKCKPINKTLCKVGWLFYLLSELVPVTLLFVVILALHISFTSGAVNGFILFSQLLDTMLIDASGVIEFPKGVKLLTQGQQIIYGFFNLEFFNIDPLSFCIWNNASVLDVLAFKYVTIAYALFLILGVILFIQKCGAKCLGKRFRITTLKNSIIHGISAFLVVCYSQCIKTSLRLLFGQYLSLHNGSVHSLRQRVWFSGDIEYYSRGHLPYAIPAIFCLLTIGIPPPLLLLAYPLTNKILTRFGVEESKFVKFFSQKIQIIAKLKPLLDSFQGSFRDNFRFFAGLYFLYRWTACLLYVSSLNYGAFYTILGLQLVCILAFHAMCQPYTKKWHNLLDTLLFTNLVIINVLTSVNYYSTRVTTGGTNTDNVRATAWIQLVFIYIPIVYMFIYTATKVCKKLYSKSEAAEGGEGDRGDFKKLLDKSLSWTRRDSQNEEEDELPYRMVVGENVEYEAYYTNAQSDTPQAAASKTTATTAV